MALKVVVQQDSTTEKSKRVDKFYAKAGEDFHIWATRTEAAWRVKSVFTVVSGDVFGTIEGTRRQDPSHLHTR